MSTLFTQDPAVPEPPKEFCRTCIHREKWSHFGYTGQYCGVRKSKRTENGLLKIKVTMPACLAYKKKEKK